MKLTIHMSIVLVAAATCLAGCGDSDSKENWLAQNDESSGQVDGAANSKTSVGADTAKMPPLYNADNPPPGSRKLDLVNRDPIPTATPSQNVPEFDNPPVEPVETQKFYRPNPFEPQSVNTVPVEPPTETQPQPEPRPQERPRPQSQTSPTQTSDQSTQLSTETVYLKRGVALAQTLPRGEAMTFSVTYQLRQSLPSRSARFFWVIVDRGGDQAAFPVTFQKNSDTLYAIVQKWRSDRVPFRCHIEAVSPNGTRQRISNSAALPRTK